MNLQFKYWVEQSEHRFSCVMAKFNDPAIVNWTKASIEKDELYTDEADHGLETDTHVTVLYGLHTNSPDEVEKLFQNEKPFKIRLGKINKFENNPKFDVLKIEIKSPDLYRLNKKMRTLEYTSRYDYNPHCTLAYLQKGACQDLVGNKRFENKEVMIDKIIFSSKDRVKKTINLT